MRLTLRHALAVELRHLLDEVVIVVIMEQDRSVRAYGERVLVAFDRVPASVVVGAGCVSIIVVSFGTG